MLNFLKNIKSQLNTDEERNQIAKLLKVDKKALDKFEESYKKASLSYETDNFFDLNSKEASGLVRKGELPDEYDEKYATELIKRIVKELVSRTDTVSEVDGVFERREALPDPNEVLTTNEDIKGLPEEIRPQLTGTLMQMDCSGPMNAYMLLSDYARYLEAKSPKAKHELYGLFRQGLDILDLDPIMYTMLGMNRNNMSYWLPEIAKASKEQGFFKIPETKIAKVPLSILQMSRLEYFSLTPATLKIVDDWAMEVFDLDVNKTYFIKTGVYSSKYDFRNAKVQGEKEVRELGEYLLFIQNQATSMAGPLVQPHSIYGAATTNEWVVREYIEDKENNPTIYKGLPLHTEYRFFVDFDTDEVLGVNPYWDPDVMLKRFSEGAKDSPHHYHDYVIYKAHEEVLMGRYNENVDMLTEKVKGLLSSVNLTGQWSLDIMQNGDDFWIIDMAIAETSALKDCVPKGKLKHEEENWIPDIKLLDIVKEDVYDGN